MKLLPRIAIFLIRAIRHRSIGPALWLDRLENSKRYKK